MRFQSAEEIAGYPIGGGLTIGDVGRVIPVKSVRDRLARLDGRYSFDVEIQKDSQANTVATCERVVAAIAELEADPRLEQFEFLPLWNQGEIIEASLDQLRSTAISGGWLAVLVLLLFLRRLRLTLAVALSIPFSVILAVAVGYFGGGTFNLLTMCGITLAIGMLVDNSIVVIENIERLRGEGLSLRAAAVQGTREVGLAVTLSTMTTIVVFLPVIFMTRNPILAMMFAELGLPLCLALAFSLLAALVFLPVLVARMGSTRPRAVQRAAAALSPLLALPARAVAYLAGGLRAVAHGLLVALHLVCRPRAVARLPPALGAGRGRGGSGDPGRDARGLDARPARAPGRLRRGDRLALRGRARRARRAGGWRWWRSRSSACAAGARCSPRRPRAPRASSRRGRRSSTS